MDYHEEVNTVMHEYLVGDRPVFSNGWARTERYESDFNALNKVANKCIEEMDDIILKEGGSDKCKKCIELYYEVWGNAFDIEKLYESIFNAIIFINKHKTS